MGYIYAIGESSDGPVKIGLTIGTVVKRLSDIQISHYKALHVLASVEVPDVHIRQIERHLHLTLQQHSLRGEWFAIRITQEHLEQLIQPLKTLLASHENTVPMTSHAPHEDGPFFLEPDPSIPSVETLDDLGAQFTYTYGADDEEVELSIHGPDPAQTLDTARAIVAYYCSHL